MSVKVNSLILMSMLLFGVVGIGILGLGAPAEAVEYPPVPSLLVTSAPWEYDPEYYIVATVSLANLDAYWDAIAFDIYLWFNMDALYGIAYGVDPDGWWASFYPGGIFPVDEGRVTHINYTDGYARISFTGLTGPGGEHTAPSGSGKLFQVLFAINNPEAPMDLRLRNPDPRPEVPPWGTEYFRCSVVGVPHPEREEAPWHNAVWTVPLPHLTCPAIAKISASTTAPKTTGEVITFDGSESYHPDIITDYAWDFGDGATATGVTATHAFAARGFFEVTLTVTDVQGGTDSDSLKIGVHPIQWFKVDKPVQYLSRDPINTFTARITNQGTASGDVKAVFTVSLGGETVVTLEASGTVLPGSMLDLAVDFAPSSTGKYTVNLALEFDETAAWIQPGHRVLTFSARP